MKPKSCQTLAEIIIILSFHICGNNLLTRCSSILHARIVDGRGAGSFLLIDIKSKLRQLYITKMGAGINQITPTVRFTDPESAALII